jgi:hypothetical protein
MFVCVRLQLIGDYLPAGASQLLTFPFLLISLSILIHRLSPQGTGSYFRNERS